jgi:hypothetical protein
MMSNRVGRIQISGVPTLAVALNVMLLAFASGADNNILQALSCSNLPAVGFIKHSGAFYLRISIDNQEKWTPAAKRSKNPIWNDTLSL